MRIKIILVSSTIAVTVFIVLLGVTMVAASSIGITVPPGFKVSIFAEIDNPSAIAFGPPGSPLENQLFITSAVLSVPILGQGSNDKILSIALDGTISPFAELSAEADPMGLEFAPPGSPFGADLFIVANNLDFGQPGDQGGSILKMDSSGNVSFFTPSHPPTILGEPSNIAFGSGDYFGTNMFIANSSDLPANIVPLTPDGQIESESLFHLDIGPRSIEFGPGGSFGTNLFMIDSHSNIIYTMNADGELTPFAELPIDPYPRGVVGDLEFAPNGAFGGDLFVTAAIGDAIEDHGVIFRVKPDGSVEEFAVGLPGYLGAIARDISGGNFALFDALEFSADGYSLFVIDYHNDCVLKIQPCTWPIERDDFPVCSTTILGFDYFLDGTPIPTPHHYAGTTFYGNPIGDAFSSLGVLCSSNAVSWTNDGNGVGASSLPNALSSNGLANQLIDFTFVDIGYGLPKMVGAHTADSSLGTPHPYNDVKATFYDKEGNILGVVDNSTDGFFEEGKDFLGLASSVGIARVTFDVENDPDPVNDDYFIDDLMFTYYFTSDMNLPKGWSMISLPVAPWSPVLSDVFPGAEVVYRYERDAGYVRVQQHEELEVGEGYWILLNEARPYTLTGAPICEYTMPVADGWYMIGGCTDPAQVIPHGCDICVIYGYDQGVGYQRVLESECLEPGKGYWICIKDATDQATISVEVDCQCSQ